MTDAPARRTTGNRGPDVTVREHDGDPIDVDEWVDRYVAVVLELEGVRPRVALPPAASIG